MSVFEGRRGPGRTFISSSGPGMNRFALSESRRPGADVTIMAPSSFSTIKGRSSDASLPVVMSRRRCSTEGLFRVSGDSDRWTSGGSSRRVVFAGGPGRGYGFNDVAGGPLPAVDLAEGTLVNGSGMVDVVGRQLLAVGLAEGAPVDRSGLSDVTGRQLLTVGLADLGTGMTVGGTWAITGILPSLESSGGFGIRVVARIKLTSPFLCSCNRTLSCARSLF